MQATLWKGNLKERDHVRDAGVDEGLILKLGCEVFNCIQLVQDRIKCRTLVIRVMKLTSIQGVNVLLCQLRPGPIESNGFSPRTYSISIRVDRVGFVVDEVTLRQTVLRMLSVSLFSSLSTNTPYTFMRRITTFRSTTDHIYDGGPIIL